MMPGSGHFFSRASARKGGRPQAWSTWPWVYTAAAIGAGSTARTAAKVRSRVAKLPVSTRTRPASVRRAVTLAQVWKKSSPGASSSCLPVGRQRSRRGISPRQKRSARSSTSPMWARTLAQEKSTRQWRGIDRKRDSGIIGQPRVQRAFPVLVRSEEHTSHDPLRSACCSRSRRALPARPAGRHGPAARLSRRRGQPSGRARSRRDREPPRLGSLRGPEAQGEVGGPMRRFILRRMGYAALSLLLLSLTIFLFVRLTGDPTVLLIEPHGSFMAGLARGDLGQSFYYRTPVVELYLSRLPNSLLLALVAMSFSLLIGIPSGILASVRVNTWWDNAGKLFALLGLSLPSFWTGLLLILFFSVYLGWLPSSGSGTPLHLLMPAFALGWYFAAAHMRLTRSSMLEVLGSEYVKLARLKGLPEALVIAKHAFKNALIPVLTLAGINLVLMVNVAVVVETVFAWPGVGRLLFEGISFRDFPVVQATVLLGGIMIVVVNLIIDVLYAVIDPRIRYEG